MTTASKKRSAARAPSPAKRRVPVLGITFAVVAVVIVAAIVLAGGAGNEVPFGTVTVTGDPLPAFTGQGIVPDDPAVGSTIPTVTGADFDGNAVTIAPGTDAMGILFVAHWCPHCQAEVPRVVDWLNATGGVAGTQIVAVSTDMRKLEDNYPPDEWLDREEWTEPVLVDDEALTALTTFGGSNYPFWVFVDSAGKVVARVSGEFDTSTLEGLLTWAAGS